MALAIGIEQWPVLRGHASWVSFAAVLMLTVGTTDPARYALNYAGLTLLGAAIGVLVTTVLFPPLQLTAAVRRIETTRTLLARHLQDIAAGLRHGEVPTPADWLRRGQDLEAALDHMRRAEGVVERARRANPRARRWGGSAASIREQSRALDRVAVLVDDVTTLVVEFQPHRRGIDRIDGGTGWVLADALDGLAARRLHPVLDGLGRGDTRRARCCDRRRRRGPAAADDPAADHRGPRRRGLLRPRRGDHRHVPLAGHAAGSAPGLDAFPVVSPRPIG